MDNPAFVRGKSNILGLGFILLWTIGFIAIVYFVGPYPTIRRQALTMAFGLVLAVLDLVLRYRQPLQPFILRFISDIHGGAVAYVPSWIWTPLLSSIATFAWLNEK
jgi:hypothetical protein